LRKNGSMTMDAPEFPDRELREYTPVEILAIAHEARAMAGTTSQKLDRLREAHPDFWFRYPRLMELCCEGCDMQRLGFMLSMLGEVKKEARTIESADQEVHESLSKAYIPENLRPSAAAPGEGVTLRGVDPTI